MGDAGLWRGCFPWSPPVWTPLLDLAVAALAGGLLGRWAPLLRALTPARDLDHAVHLAAEAAFYRLGLRKTRESTGILLYVSLAERRAVVLADDGIAAKVPAETWDEVCGLLLAGAAAHDLASGYETALRRCADILAKPFPPRRRNPNELADGLRIIP
jgi:putative membrane protein